MNKEEKMVYLFTKRLDKEQVLPRFVPEREHEWKLTHCDPLKYYVEYTCRCCGHPMAEYVYDIANTQAIIQLLNFKAPKCK